MTNGNNYSYDVQLAHFDVYQVEDRGHVDVDDALRVFREFPFEEQLHLASTLEEATAPTISFRSQADGAVLAIWANRPQDYEVYLESSSGKVTVDETDTRQIEQIIFDFFAGQRKGLQVRLSRRAQAEQGLFGRIAAFLRR